MSLDPNKTVSCQTRIHMYAHICARAHIHTPRQEGNLPDTSQELGDGRILERRRKRRKFQPNLQAHNLALNPKPQTLNPKP